MTIDAVGSIRIQAQLHQITSFALTNHESMLDNGLYTFRLKLEKHNLGVNQATGRKNDIQAIYTGPCGENRYASDTCHRQCK